MSSSLDPRIDAYIAKAAEFARPILRHLRACVHRGCPEVTESIKWGMPHFDHAGGILCGMAAFKAHCTFGFWHHSMNEVLGAHAGKSDGAMGSFGRITTRSDLPDDRTVIRFVKAAVKLNESGAPGRPRPAAQAPKKEPAVPPDLATALKQNRAAAKAFTDFSPSHRKEYIEWITEAKRDDTRTKRLATTIEWLTEGKSRNWKYASC
jgi:uncharacterized protein YdeI (YjbR/CyaY-like superfamily)